MLYNCGQDVLFTLAHAQWHGISYGLAQRYHVFVWRVCIRRRYKAAAAAALLYLRRSMQKSFDRIRHDILGTSKKGASE